METQVKPVDPFASPAQVEPGSTTTPTSGGGGGVKPAPEFNVDWSNAFDSAVASSRNTNAIENDPFASVATSTTAVTANQTKLAGGFDSPLAGDPFANANSSSNFEDPWSNSSSNGVKQIEAKSSAFEPAFAACEDTNASPSNNGFGNDDINWAASVAITSTSTANTTTTNTTTANSAAFTSNDNAFLLSNGSFNWPVSEQASQQNQNKGVKSHLLLLHLLFLICLCYFKTIKSFRNIIFFSFKLLHINFEYLCHSIFT